MGYLIEGHPENDQALTQPLCVPDSKNKQEDVEDLATPVHP